MHRNRGSMLLEILLVMGVMIMVMPVMMRKGFLARQDQQNQAVAHKMKMLGAIVLNYIQSYPDDLEEGLNVIADEQLTDLFTEYGLSSEFNTTDFFGHVYEVHINRKNSDDGSFQLDALVVAYAPIGDGLNFLRRKKIAEYLGLSGAILDEDGTLMSLVGMWNDEEGGWEHPLPLSSIVMRVRPVDFFNTYLSRTQIDSLGNANTMTTDLYMSGHSIERVKTFYAVNANFSHALGEKMTVMEGFGSGTDEDVEKQIFSGEFETLYSYSDSGSENDVLLIQTPLKVSGGATDTTTPVISGYDLYEADDAGVTGTIGLLDLTYMNLSSLLLHPKNCDGQSNCSETAAVLSYKMTLGSAPGSDDDAIVLSSFDFTDARVTVDNDFYDSNNLSCGNESCDTEYFHVNSLKAKTIFFNYDSDPDSDTYRKYFYKLNLSGTNTVIYDMDDSDDNINLTTRVLQLYNRFLIKRTTGK